MNLLRLKDESKQLVKEGNPIDSSFMLNYSLLADANANKSESKGLENKAEPQDPSFLEQKDSFGSFMLDKK